MQICHAVFVCAALLFVSVAELRAENWSQFRGGQFDGVSKSDFPEDWNASKNVRWKIPIQGEGWSCPIVWEDQVVITVAIPTSEGQPADEQYQQGERGKVDLTTLTYRWEVISLDANTGEVIWRKVARAGNPRLRRHRDNSYATETPVTDGQKIIAYFGMTGVYCYDMQGKLLWEKDLGNYAMRADWGTSSSPVLFGGKVFLQVDNEQQSFLVALDADSGDEIWRVDRDEASQYSSPVIWKNSLRTELVACGMKCRSYDLDSGKLLWELDMEKGRSSATPLVVGDRLFVGTEFRDRGGPDDGGGFLFAIRPTASGKKVEWKTAKSGIQMASPVLASNHLYLFERRSGTLHCIDATTGEKVYRKRIPGARAFWASPWVGDGKVFCLDDAGTTHVLEAGSQFSVIRKNPLEERAWSSPAIANEALYIRTEGHLYRISKEG